jgi:hypothetical protein
MAGRGARLCAALLTAQRCIASVHAERRQLRRPESTATHIGSEASTAAGVQVTGVTAHGLPTPCTGAGSRLLRLLQRQRRAVLMRGGAPWTLWGPMQVMRGLETPPHAQLRWHPCAALSSHTPQGTRRPTSCAAPAATMRRVQAWRAAATPCKRTVWRHAAGHDRCVGQPPVLAAALLGVTAARGSVKRCVCDGASTRRCLWALPSGAHRSDAAPRRCRGWAAGWVRRGVHRRPTAPALAPLRAARAGGRDEPPPPPPTPSRARCTGAGARGGGGKTAGRWAKKKSCVHADSNRGLIEVMLCHDGNDLRYPFTMNAT